MATQCNDPKCPKHGKLKLRGQTFVGRVVKYAMHKVATVEWPRIVKVPKYERAFRTVSRVKAYVPECLKDKVKVGDLVKIQETRKLAKTVAFVITEVIEHGEGS